ncbi:MAG: ECF transporter S component [Negativibacillus sp.]|mgnify:FL=1|nr:ECF transporter S component [Negativibacillus sp.]
MTNVITPNRSANTPSKVQMITLVGVFAAISTILMCFELPLPLMPPFLKVDLSGVPILIMGFLYGPLPAIYVTIIKDLIHMLSTQTGCVGELADMIVLSSFAVVSSLLYRRNPSRKGVLISVLAGAATITVVGSLANKFMLIPFYSKVMPLEAIIDACHAVNPMINSINAYVIFGAAPFNLVKGLILSFLTLLLYQKLAGFIQSRTSR